ncbi:unnamed protein product [Onchocerca flexuosa]|uniref:C3H1-type domain-containing protein n=1 Tax=Onchocerca flexuosa TaxID=387005 RepID=A0A183I2B8_9BILA|nr:unnamed protein product [Onchocerca flexuosa]
MDDIFTSCVLVDADDIIDSVSHVLAVMDMSVGMIVRFRYDICCLLVWEHQLKGVSFIRLFSAGLYNHRTILHLQANSQCKCLFLIILGLEGDVELATDKSGASTVAASKKKGSLPSKALLDAKKRTGVSSSIPKVSTVNISPPLPSVPFSDKKPASNTPARVMMSNTFMDALMDPVNKKALPKQTKKRSTLNLKPSTSVIPSVMEGLYSDTSKSLNKDKQDEGSVDEKKEVLVEEPDIIPIGNRKIRFADEHGQELVEIRYFEIEEVNVSKLSSEDMKHLEMQRERTFLKEQRSLHITEFGFSSGRSEGITHIPWKLIPLTDAVFFERRGSQSEAKKIEEERQKTIMMPFYDPSLPAELADAEPELLSGAILPPTEIPLEPEADDEDLNQNVAHAFANATVATGNLAGQNQNDKKEIDVQKLMTELKKKGLVGSSSDLASILNKVSSTTATFAGTAATSAPSASQVTLVTTAPYAHLTTLSGVPNIPNTSLPPPRFTHGLPMPPVLSAGQYIFPVQQQQPLLNGPVPAGVTPTVGVDLTTQSGPSTSEASSYGIYGRAAVKQCTFYQSGTCSYGARCRFAHGDEPTVGTQGYGYSDERGRSFRRSGQLFRGIPRRGGADGGYSPRAIHECDQEGHFEKRSRSDDRERDDQHVVDVENQLADSRPQLQEHHDVDKND